MQGFSTLASRLKVRGLGSLSPQLRGEWGGRLMEEIRVRDKGKR